MGRAGERRRREILDAALDELGRRGLEGLSMAGVARRVGLVPSGLYRHFAGKEEILDAVIEGIGDRLRGLAEEAAATRQGPLEALRKLLLSHVALIRSCSGIPRVMFGEVIFGVGGDLRAKGRGVVEGYLEAVTELFREGQRRGEIRPGPSPRTLAIMFLGLIQPLAVLWALTDGAVDVTAQARRSWAVFREAIRAAEPPGERQRK